MISTRAGRRARKASTVYDGQALFSGMEPIGMIASGDVSTTTSGQYDSPAAGQGKSVSSVDLCC
ncbi:hypothetical protein D9M68_808280 [compost metagenome]